MSNQGGGANKLRYEGLVKITGHVRKVEDSEVWIAKVNEYPILVQGKAKEEALSLIFPTWEAYRAQNGIVRMEEWKGILQCGVGADGKFTFLVPGS